MATAAGQEAGAQKRALGSAGDPFRQTRPRRRTPSGRIQAGDRASRPREGTNEPVAGGNTLPAALIPRTQERRPRYAAPQSAPGAAAGVFQIVRSETKLLAWRVSVGAGVGRSLWRPPPRNNEARLRRRLVKDSRLHPRAAFDRVSPHRPAHRLGGREVPPCLARAARGPFFRSVSSLTPSPLLFAFGSRCRPAARQVRGVACVPKCDL
jgi:hypothetical protein